MVRRTVNMGENEPEQKVFEIPSEGEKLFQVVDVYDKDTQIGRMSLDDNTVCVKCEVAIGDELGRSLLMQLSLDPTWKGFFATRLFLKAIGEPHKGDKVDIDTDEWCGRQFFAEVVHNGKYANIKEYNFEKCAGIKQTVNPFGVTNPKDVAWEE